MSFDIWNKWIARGNTFPYKDDFMNWGWFWNAEKRRWEYETDDENDSCLQVMIRKAKNCEFVKLEKDEA